LAKVVAGTRYFEVGSHPNILTVAVTLPYGRRVRIPRRFVLAQ
jgi:hypothetical protein